MVNVPPWYSSGLSFPSRALAASDFVSAEMAARPRAPAFLMMGVMRPLGVATATQMSACLYLERQYTPADTTLYSLSDSLTQPSRVGLGDLSKSERGGLDD